MRSVDCPDKPTHAGCHYILRSGNAVAAFRARCLPQFAGRICAYHIPRRHGDRRAMSTSGNRRRAEEARAYLHAWGGVSYCSAAICDFSAMPAISSAPERRVGEKPNATISYAPAIHAREAERFLNARAKRGRCGADAFWFRDMRMFRHAVRAADPARYSTFCVA